MSKSSLNQNKQALHDNRQEEIIKSVSQAKKNIKENPRPIDHGPASQKQINFLKKFGKKVIEDPHNLENLTKDQAAELIDKIQNEKITSKQADLLIRNGYSQSAIANMSRFQASIAIKKIVAMTPAQEQALVNAGINIQELRDNKIYLTKSEASKCSMRSIRTLRNKNYSSPLQ